MEKEIYALLVIYVIVIFRYSPTAGKAFKWSDENGKTAAKLTCLPTELITNYQLKEKEKAGNRSALGRVEDSEVCGLLCCEVETCDMAILEGDRCSSVQCASVDSCELEQVKSDEKIEIIKFTRKSGSDIWSKGGEASSHQPKIVTKQAAVEKSIIPQTKINTPKSRDSIISISNTDKNQSPMDALLQKESAIVKAKHTVGKPKSSSKNSTESFNNKPNVGQKIQDITEHYLKADEKTDMTALQENDTTVMHSLNIPRHHRDLRHTLISPITIGAFTCMTVIAVSGFAMAIIKYQRERKEYEDKQTQKP